MAVTEPVPVRVDAVGKAGLLGLVDHAVGEGWSLQAVCEVLKISRRRVERWQARRTDLADRKPGGVAVNGLLDDEVQQILAVFNEWGERDRSHRRLAHRGSYVGRFWASPSTVRRVLIESDKHFRPLPRPVRGERKPFPDWASYKPNSLWIYDTTHFTRCGAKVLIIEDLVSRKWLTHLVSSEETTTQVQAAFTTALESEGLLKEALARAATGRVGDCQQVRPFGLQGAVQRLDPRLIGRGGGPAEVLRDRDQGHEPAGAGGDHLRPVVGDCEQQWGEAVVGVGVDPAGRSPRQRVVEEALGFEGGGERGLDLGGGFLAGDQMGEPFA